MKNLPLDAKVIFIISIFIASQSISFTSAAEFERVNIGSFSRASTSISSSQIRNRRPARTKRLESSLSNSKALRSFSNAQLKSSKQKCTKYLAPGDSSMAKSVIEIIQTLFVDINRPQYTDISSDKVYYSFPDLLCVDKEIRDFAIQQVISMLNDRSTYYSQGNRKQLSDEGTIGIDILKVDGKAMVSRLTHTSIHDVNNISVGDELVLIDNDDVSLLSEREILNKFRGPLNSVASLVINRSGLQKQFFLKRLNVTLPGMTVYTTNSIPTMRIENFSISSKLLREIFLSISESNKSILVDLRGNYGGYFSDISSYAGVFAGSGQIMAVLRTNKGFDYLKTNSDKVAPDHFRLYFLVDKFTASGAEILVAYLQEIGRAIIIGERTAGYTNVARYFSFDTGEELTLSVADATTPRGKQIRNVGVMPDFVLESRTYTQQHLDAIRIIESFK